MSAAFQCKLAENLDFGHILEIGAKAEIEASCFSISLATKKSKDHENSQIGLHILVQLIEEQIVFKQKINEEWIEVDNYDYDTAIFRQRFTINILMAEEKFYISANNEFLTIVRYGLPLTELKTLRIEGDLAMIKQVDHRKCFPYPWPPIQMMDSNLNFSHDTPSSMKPGHVMVMHLKLLGKMNGRLHLDFRNIWNHKHLEVHISIRFDTKRIIRNSKLTLQNDNTDKTEYGVEETHGAFPFDDLAKPFKLAVAFTEGSLKMSKDGIFLFDYAWKTSKALSNLAGLKILGINGMKVHVMAIDHYRMDELSCDGFERYSLNSSDYV